VSDELDVLRARVAELERCAERAEADATRLREVLAQVRDAMLATGQAPDGDDDPRRPLAAAVWRALASAPSAAPTPRDTLNTPQHPPITDDAGPEVWPALLSEVALSPELRALCMERDALGRAKYGTTPRDMRVASAVREACFGIADFGAGGREGVMESIRSLDLAAVVAKAVGL